MVPTSYNHHHGIITLRVQQSYAYLGGDFKIIHRKEIMLGTGNLAKDSV